ncbi:MAG TPA: hypothetical protein VMR33_05790 [Candidatus Baltobacteraceae bacterium]|jgi:hypothetical protein|nr:hypothetical protein [Candidatus Baltobacteraceae bacterium]
MNTNSALIIPAQSPAASNAAPLVFHDTVKPLIQIANVWAWVFWIVGVLVVLGACWLWWRHWKRTQAVIAAPPPVPPHVHARRMLEAALSLISEPKPFSIAVSGAIRVYLEQRFDFHAPDRTTEEFLYELQGTDLLTAEQKESLADFLASCDLIKFAKYEPTETELRALHTAALRLVNETEPRWSGSQSTAAQAPVAASAEK